MEYPTIESCIGETPLVRLQRLSPGGGNTVLLKMEGDNPAGSVKDRPAISMIRCAEERGELQPGDTLIEATSGNTGIALAMAAAIRGYRMVLVMPSNMSDERKWAMSSYGAELVEVSEEMGMEGARDLALEMEQRGEGKVLDQFANPDNPRAHYEGTGPELWRQTGGELTHFVSAMGTTGTVMGVSRFLKEKNPRIEIIGLQPAEGESITGIRRWPKEYLPKIFEREHLDRIMEVSEQESREMTRLLARREGICCGVSSGGAVAGALHLAGEVRDAVIVTVICDRGDRYLSTGLFAED